MVSKDAEISRKYKATKIIFLLMCVAFEYLFSLLYVNLVAIMYRFDLSKGVMDVRPISTH